MERPCEKCIYGNNKSFYNCQRCVEAPVGEYPGFEAKEEKGCHNCVYRKEPPGSIPCAFCISASEGEIHHDNWVPKEDGHGCHDCQCRFWPEREKPCERCNTAIRPDGTYLEPSHWISEKEDQECVDTDNVKPIPKITIDWERSIDRSRAKELINSVYGSKYPRLIHQDTLGAYRNALARIDEMLKRTKKEETMPTRNNNTTGNMYFNYARLFGNPAPKLPGIKKVIFSNPCTIVLWDDGTKTMVRAQGKERFDREKGLAMAIAKKALGNKGNYYDTFTEHLSKPVAKKKKKK